MAESTNTQILLAGAVAAFTVDLLIYPLDTIKTRYQSQDFLKTFASSTKRAKVPASVFRGLYQGVGSVIVATLPAAGLFFTTYESAKTIYRRALPSVTPQPVVHAIAAGTAELASCLVLTPAEVIKQNAQVLRQSPTAAGASSSSSTQALRMLWRADGGPARRLWMGYTALAARNLPFTALQFPVFEFVRGRMWRWRGRRRGSGLLRQTDRAGQLVETGLVTGVSAAASGAVAAVLTTPTDVVKTRIMLAAGQIEKEAAGGEKAGGVLPGGNQGSRKKRQESYRRRRSGLQVARQVFQEKGVLGLFRGGALRATWTALGSGLYLGTYEVAKVWLRDGE